MCFPPKRNPEANFLKKFTGVESKHARTKASTIQKHDKCSRHLGIFPHTLCSKYAFSIALQITNEIALPFVGLAYQGKDIVFRFSMEYCSLRDFSP
jgi:hypothetical protein